MVKQRVKSEVYLDNILNESSFYKHCSIFIDPSIFPGRRRLGRWNRIDIDTTNIENWKIHTVTETDYQRLDLIAYNYYGRADYWRAIAQVNKIGNPLEDISINDELAIPPKEIIENAIGISE